MEASTKRRRVCEVPRELQWKGVHFQRACPINLTEDRESLSGALPLSANGCELPGVVACYADFRYCNVYAAVIFPESTDPDNPYPVCHFQIFTTENERDRSPTLVFRHEDPLRWLPTPRPSVREKIQWMQQMEASRLWGICLAAAATIDASRLAPDDKLKGFHGQRIRPMLVPDPRSDLVGSLTLTIEDQSRDEFILENYGLHFQHKPRDARIRYISWRGRTGRRQKRGRSRGWGVGSPVFTLLHRLMHSPASGVLMARFTREKDYIVCCSILAPFCPAPKEHEQMLILKTPDIVVAPLSWGEKTPAFFTKAQGDARPPCMLLTVPLQKQDGIVDIVASPSADMPGRAVVMHVKGQALRGLRPGDLIMSMKVGGVDVMSCDQFVFQCNILRRDTIDARLVVLRSRTIVPFGIPGRLNPGGVMHGYDTMPNLFYFVLEFLSAFAASAIFPSGMRMDPLLAGYIASFIPMDAWDARERKATNDDVMQIRGALELDPAALSAAASALFRSKSGLGLRELAAFSAAAGPVMYDPEGLAGLRLLCAKWSMAERAGRLHLCTRF